MAVSIASVHGVKTSIESVAKNSDLVSVRRVEGTSVYNAEGDQLGSIYDIMIDKRSGKVAYAIMSFGGFLGIGEKYHPLPWKVLTYDEGKGGYNIGITEAQLRGGPSYSESELDEFVENSHGRRVSDYYLDDEPIVELAKTPSD